MTTKIQPVFRHRQRGAILWIFLNNSNTDHSSRHFFPSSKDEFYKNVPQLYSPLTQNVSIPKNVNARKVNSRQSNQNVILTEHHQEIKLKIQDRCKRTGITRKNT